MSDLETSDETRQAEIPYPVLDAAEVAPALESLPEPQSVGAVETHVFAVPGVFDSVLSPDMKQAATDLLDKAISAKEEREACAALAETFSPSSPTWTDTRQGIADAIRARE